MATRKSSESSVVDALELLTSQHEEVDKLFEQIESKKGDVRAAFLELADKLAAHATIEEKLFYPAVMEEETSDMLHESVEEHLAIKRVLADLIEMDLASEEFDAKISVLKEEVSHHAHEEEEDKLFPKVRKMMSADERAALGNDLLAMFEELLPTHPSRLVPSQTAEAAPLPRVSSR